MAETKDQMIYEEQIILDDLIERMEEVGYSLQRTLTGSIAKRNEAKDSSVAEAYGSLVDASNSIKSTKEAIKEFHRSRDELYDTRLVLDYVNEKEQGEDELKVGLHDYPNFVVSWRQEACRPFILNDSLTESDCIVVGKYGERYKTHYKLKLKRQVDLEFDTVIDVTQLFPLKSEKEEQVIADEFLKELLKRRAEQEFRNIVFSIQKQQGEIIQTPFYQNMIVQGCAGSGKSMIMLHRLPIILFDNPHALSRNNLYIITPSITYIQMANNMRIDLEIEDLKMGTLNQYYDHVIRKYGREPEAYGVINYGHRLTKELQDYIYSEKAVHYIQDSIKIAIESKDVDIEKGLSFFTLEEKTVNSDIPVQCLRNKIGAIQRILQENDNVLRRRYYTRLRECVQKLTDISRMLSSRKTAVTRGINKKISEAEETKNKAEKALANLDPVKNKVAYENRQAIINSSLNHILEYTTVLEDVGENSSYFRRLKKLGSELDRVLEVFTAIRKEWHEISIDEIYDLVEKRDLLCNSYTGLINAPEMDDEYWEYAGSMYRTLRAARSSVDGLKNISSKYLPLDYQKSLKAADQYYTSLEKDIVDSLYLLFMKKLGVTSEEGTDITALSCSPFIYLQILYQYQGAPNGTKESLITIDEAQNLEPEELRLISNVNEGKVIFNLFGDVKQHFEESKGIDSWEAFSPVIDYQLYNMRENYRNARQITNYCNRTFNMNMRAINTDGRGVHILNESMTLYEQLRILFQRPQNPGLSCIIVKSREEANTIYEKMGALQTRIHNMAADPGELKNVKWNLMTIDQTKGLEFETVIAISGRMTENEKYVAFTRALDELFIYNTEIELIPKDEETEAEPVSDTTAASTRKKRKKKSSDEKQDNTKSAEMGCKEFFEQSGLEVIDTRNKGGYLWVIGRREEIEEIINRAIEKYGISGGYSFGKATRFRPGWYTNTKK